ncbi:glycosyltransferase family 2 protein [Prochlorococcus sp. MIT 1341]|uniref:glycosyltransferase family 2 protein n=1 Tax=Prochlorococcus sp. MIT 1341 TaxID=3096221 RepID=UPI002A766693|nr:glycosyltransferase family 2 protein [Prochlorococcus sp. MIT 1341]
MPMPPTIKRLSVVLPTYNERENISPLINKLLQLTQTSDVEIIVVDDDSQDGTAEIVKKISQENCRIRLIRRVGRSGLASAIKEGLLAATGDIAAVMDSDGQHEPIALINALALQQEANLDLVAGSRFLEGAEIHGLSKRRTGGSTLANNFARMSLSKNYRQLTDYMSGCFVIKLKSCLNIIYKVDVNGFKFLYEILSVSRGKLKVGEIPLSFQPRSYGNSKLDLAILWDFLISVLHTLTLRLLPRRAISFALVGSGGVLVQLLSTEVLMIIFQLAFQKALPISVIIAATSNYLINNALTFRSQRLVGKKLAKGLLKFLLVASLPVIANVGLATTFYNLISPNPVIAQLAGIIVVFVWNYAASSRFVWNTP